MSISNDPRSQNTKARLLVAATDLFATHGYDGVSTRKLVDAAGVNLAAVNYHFGSKDGLYHAVIAIAGTSIAERNRETEILLDQGLELARANPTAMVFLAHSYLMRLFTLLIADKDMHPSVRLVMREFFQPGPADAAIRESVFAPLEAMTVKLLDAVKKPEPNAPPLTLDAHVLLAPLLLFAGGAPVAMADLGWDDSTEEHVGALQAAIIDHALAALNLRIPNSG